MKKITVVLVLVFFLLASLMVLGGCSKAKSSSPKVDTKANLEAALKKHGLTLPPGYTYSGGAYYPIKEFGNNLAYFSGMLPTVDGKTFWTGRIGKELTIEEGQNAARACALNIVADMIDYYGSLDKINLVKTTVYVVPAEDFHEMSQISNAASQFFIDILGEERGKGTRSTVGVYSLVKNNPVEVEVLVELK